MYYIQIILIKIHAYIILSHKRISHLLYNRPSILEKKENRE